MFGHMAKEGLYVAIDVGTTKVCTLVARVAHTGELEIVSRGVAPSCGVKKGMVVSLEDTRAAVRTAVEISENAVDHRLPQAYVGVTGSHLRSYNNSASSTIANTNDVISWGDVSSVMCASLPEIVPQQQVMHVLPRSFEIDGVRSMRTPIGLHAQKLEVESHIILMERAPLENVVTAVKAAGIGIRSLVLEPLASSEAVLTADEREMGVILVDIGGGTSDMAIFRHGSLWHTAVIPVGGYQFTNDLALALGIPFPIAEVLKVQHGHVNTEGIDPKEQVDIPEIDHDGTRQVPRSDICRLLHERAAELVRLLMRKAQEAGMDSMPAGGIIVTGGSAKLPGLTHLIKEMTGAEVRIGVPRSVPGIPEALHDPVYATGVGILLWGIRYQDELLPYNGYNPSGTPWHHRLARWFSRLFPSNGR